MKGFHLVARTLVAIGMVGAASTSAGCWFGSPPETSHRHVMPRPEALADLAAPAPRRLIGAAPIVLGRFDGTAQSPIGGVYDHVEHEVTPLVATYFFADGPIEIFEHVSDALRADGLAVFKDYAGRAEPALLPAAMRAQSPVLVSATITELQHDQVRRDAGSDWEVARLGADVLVRDVEGRTKLAKHYSVEGRVRYDERTQMLQLIGWKLAEAMTADPAFLAAIAARGA
jgi:hypothetical protein